ncbi:MAG: 4Fe-4S binding protein [Bacteroidetes bacterium]|nr:4Fe-4S binding protein [Bacteroidota bacterium]
MRTDDHSLSLVDSTQLKLGPWPRLLLGVSIVFAFFGIIGTPYFFALTSLSIAGFLAFSGIVVHIAHHEAIRGLGERSLRLWSGRFCIAGFIFILASVAGAGNQLPEILFVLGIVFASVGGVWLIRDLYKSGAAGDLNVGVQDNPLISRGAAGWLLGLVFTGFYVLIYWFPDTLEGLTRTTDALSWAIKGRAADHWFMYSLVYSLAILVMGVRAFYKYRRDRYHTIRTCSVVFFQVILAFVIPSILVLFNNPEYYFTYFWPLKWEYFWPGDYGFAWILQDGGRLGIFMLGWGVVMSFIATPILTYFYGKRWYCSWVCGCGGLAETLGDPFRHLSDNSLKSWKVERWLVHSVLLLIVVLTALMWINSGTQGAILGGVSSSFARFYGFVVGSVWAGVIGVGFYPMFGSRMWCRFGCPMAAVLGLQQKYFSRFRITTNSGQCISCGQCSVHCEMGIDVRWYAQRGQNIIRASCVGCGVCSSVCPRGVLKLENGPREGRWESKGFIPSESLQILVDVD